MALFRSLAYFRFVNNPIIRRELVTQLRRPSSFLQLFFFVGAASICMVYIWYVIFNSSSRINFNEEGRNSFYFMTGFLSMLVMLLIPIFSATQINLERERDTWDLLIASPISLAGILWGKFLSSILFVWLLLSALIPVYSLSMTLGGVSPEEVVFVAALLTECMAIVALLGLICSIRYKKPMNAVISAYVLAFGYFCLFPYIGLFKAMLCELMQWPQTPFLYGLPFFTSPFLVALAYFGGSVPPQGSFLDPWCISHPFLAHGIMVCLMTILLVFWAFWGLYRQKRRDERRLIAMIRTRIRRRERARRHLEPFDEKEMFSGSRNPVAEKDLREAHGPFKYRLIWTVLLLFAAGLCLMGIHYDDTHRRFYFALVWREWIPFTVVWIYPLFLIPYAAGSIRGEFDLNTWDLLRTTTLSNWRIVTGKIKAGYILFQWRFWAFYGLAFVLGFWTTGYYYWYPENCPGYLNPRAVEFVAGSCILILVSAFFYTTLAVYLSSRMRTTVRAYAATFTALLFLFSGFGIVAPFFGQGGIAFLKGNGYLISPLILCFEYGTSPRSLSGAAWWKALAIQSAWMVGFTGVLFSTTTQRIGRIGELNQP